MIFPKEDKDRICSKKAVKVDFLKKDTPKVRYLKVNFPFHSFIDKYSTVGYSLIIPTRMRIKKHPLSIPH